MTKRKPSFSMHNMGDASVTVDAQMTGVVLPKTFDKIKLINGPQPVEVVGYGTLKPNETAVFAQLWFLGRPWAIQRFTPHEAWWVHW